MGRRSVVYAFHMYSCTTCDFLSYIDSHVFLSYGLFARRYIVFDVCVFKKKMTTSVYCWCLRQVQLVGLVCLLPFLDRGLYVLMMTHWKHCLLV